MSESVRAAAEATLAEVNAINAVILPEPGQALSMFDYWLPFISFSASLRLKLARPFSSKPMNFTQV